MNKAESVGVLRGRPRVQIPDGEDVLYMGPSGETTAVCRLPNALVVGCAAQALSYGGKQFCMQASATHNII